MNYLQKYLLLFLRFLWLVVLIVGGAVGFAWLRVDKEPNVYGSVAVMEVDVGSSPIFDNIRDAQQERVNSLDAINTVVETMSSNDVMLAVADSIDRTKEWAAGSPSGQVPEDKKNSLAQSIRGQVRISLKRGTRLIEVMAEDSSPKMAQKIAEQVVAQFMLLQEAKLQKSGGKNLAVAKETREETLERLTKARQERDAFAREHGFTLIEDTWDSAGNTALLTSLTNKITALDAGLQAVKAAPPGDVDALLQIPEVAAMKELEELKSQLQARETDFTILKERYLERHPKYINAEQIIGELKSRITAKAASVPADLERQLTVAKAERERLLNRINGGSNTGASAEDYATLKKLQKDVDELDRVYNSLGSVGSDFEVTSKLKNTPYKWASQPLLNPWPLRPDKQKSMTDAGLLGLALAIGLILLIERLDSSVRTVDDAEKSLGVPVLAAVPDGDVSGVPKGGTVMTDSPGSAQAEAFRTLRASLSLTGNELTRSLMLVTSAVPAEGKTFTSINLAACLAGQGYRTLLVDGDLRRPALSATLLPRDERKGDAYRGLTDVLSGNSQPAECIRNTSVPNLSLLPAGRKAPNPSELLAQASLPALLNYLRNHFDRIIFDSAPVNAVSDSLGLATHMESVVLVLRFGKTPKRAITRALQQLKKASAKITGLVMNRVPARRGAAYYYYFYGDPYLKDSVYGTSVKKKKRRKSDADAPKPA